MRRYRPTLRMRFAVALALLCGCAVLVCGGVLGGHAASQLRARIGQSLAGDAQRIAERLNREMANRARDLALFGALDPMRSMQNPAAVQALLEALRRSEPSYLWLAVTDVTGRVIAATDGGPSGQVQLYDFRDQLRGRPTSLGDPMRFVGPGEPDPGPAANGSKQFNISRPIRAPDGTAVGVIVAQMSWDDLRASIAGLLSRDEAASQTREAVVVANNDAVLFGPAGLMGKRVALEEINRARAGIYGWSQSTWPDGRYLTGANFAAGEGGFPGAGSVPMRWTVLVREPEAVAMAPASDLWVEIGTAGLVLTGLVAGLGWVLAGIITRPLQQIARAADRLRTGEVLELPALHSSREVEMLSASLRALVASLVAKQGELDVMEEAAQRDLLTGVLNRAGLHTWLTHAVAQARMRPPSGLLLLLADLDGFKTVNDTRGHAVGDHVLQSFAHRLSSSVRSQDAVARMGGDEFLIVISAPYGLGDQAALDTTRRLWARVTEPYVVDGMGVDLGVSIGAAAWPEDDSVLDEVLNKADAALYAAKRAGKGQITFHRQAAAA